MTDKLSRELSKAESQELKEHERTIRNTSGAFVACGLALKAIREKRLYRATHHSFENYCQEVHGWGRQRAFLLIEAAELKKSLPKDVQNFVQLPSQATALLGVPKPSQRDILKKAARSGKVTARSIREAAKESKPEVQKDETGIAIPDAILEDWARADETGNRLLRMISTLRTEIKKGFDDEDIIFREVTQGINADLNNAYATIKGIVPHAVCTSCQGHGRSKCNLCKGRGWISKFLFDTAIPEETKKVRQKASV